MDSITLGRQPSTRWYCSAISCYIWDTRKHSNPERWVLSHSGPIESKGSMGTQASMTFNEVQWPSRRSKRLKGFKGFNGSKTFKGWRGFLAPWESWGPEGCCKITTSQERSSVKVLHKCNTIGMALQCVAQRHSKTQHLVRKKTNNFNDLTAVI